MEGIELTTTLFATGLEGLDQQATLWLNTHNCPFMDSFWLFMSAKLVWIPLYVLIAALLIWKLGWKKGLAAIVCVALVFFFNERANNLIKHLVERVRPCNDPIMLAAGLHVLETGGGWSFPSGHACNVFGLATSSVICLKASGRSYRRWHYTVFIFLWAFLVGLSRIMVARHFLGDVLTGAIEGSVIAVACSVLFLEICRRNRWLNS